MVTYLILLLAILVCSSSAAKCPVCESTAPCEEPVLKTCVPNDPNNPRVPSKTTTTSTTTTTRARTSTKPPTTTPADEGSGSGDGSGEDLAPTFVEGVWNDHEGFLFPFAVKEDAPRKRELIDVPIERDVPFDLFKCLYVEFRTPADNVVHVQQYCIDVEQTAEICTQYEDAVGEENVLECKTSSPNSAASYALQNILGIIILSVGVKILV